jgi:hypothetical protein
MAPSLDEDDDDDELADEIVAEAAVADETGAFYDPLGATAPDGYATALPTIRMVGFGISRKRLEQAIRELQLPVIVVRDLEEADVVMTLRSAYRQKPPTLREAEELAKPIYVLKSNTILQMQACLTSLYSVEVDPREAALRETEEAIGLVMRAAKPSSCRRRTPTSVGCSTRWPSAPTSSPALVGVSHTVASASIRTRSASGASAQRPERAEADCIPRASRQDADASPGCPGSRRRTSIHPSALPPRIRAQTLGVRDTWRTQPIGSANARLASCPRHPKGKLPAMRKPLALAMVGTAVVVLTFGAAPMLTSAADHLDAPALKNETDHPLDITDIYAFDARNSAKTVLVMDVNPLAGVVSGTRFSTRRLSLQLSRGATPDADLNDAKDRVTGPVRSGQRHRRQPLWVYRNGKLIGTGKTGRTNDLTAAPASGRPARRSVLRPGWLQPAEGLDLHRRIRADGYARRRLLRRDQHLDHRARGARSGSAPRPTWATTRRDGKRIDRMGKPGLNTVFIDPFKTDATDKDRHNQTAPANDPTSGARPSRPCSSTSATRRRRPTRSAACSCRM